MQDENNGRLSRNYISPLGNLVIRTKSSLPRDSGAGAAFEDSAIAVRHVDSNAVKNIRGDNAFGISRNDAHRNFTVRKGTFRTA